MNTRSFLAIMATLTLTTAPLPSGAAPFSGENQSRPDVALDMIMDGGRRNLDLLHGFERRGADISVEHAKCGTGQSACAGRVEAAPDSGILDDLIAGDEEEEYPPFPEAFEEVREDEEGGRTILWSAHDQAGARRAGGSIPATAPLPTTLFLIFAALAGLGFIRRRERASA